MANSSFLVKTYPFQESETFVEEWNYSKSSNFSVSNDVLNSKCDHRPAKASSLGKMELTLLLGASALPLYYRGQLMLSKGKWWLGESQWWETYGLRIVMVKVREIVSSSLEEGSWSKRDAYQGEYSPFMGSLNLDLSLSFPLSSPFWSPFSLSRLSYS